MSWITGTRRPASVSTAIPMLIAVETTILSPFQRAFKSGCFSSARAVSLTMMSVMPIERASPVSARPQL